MLKTKAIGRFLSSSSSFSSSKLAWFTVAPLIILVFCFVVFQSPKYSSWLFTHPYLLEIKDDPTSSYLLQTPSINDHVNDVVESQKAGHDNTTGDSRPPAAAAVIAATEEEIDKGLHDENVTAGDDDDYLRKTRRYYRNIERIEGDLARARASILRGGGAQSNDNDDYNILVGPMYRNCSFFRRSYEEMEKTLKVYVYEDGGPPVFHYGPCKSTYAIEGHFINAMEFSPFRTTDPNKAHVYFLPFSITVLSKLVYVANSHDWSPMKRCALDYVNSISRKYPFWNRSLGADHFMLSCHDWGPEISFAVPNLHNNSIRALCNANTSERFDPKKDVSIPEIHLPSGTTASLIGGPSPSKRPVLVFYAGGLHGPVRPILLKHWENKDENVQVHSYLPKNVSYHGMMRKSRYCICPSGFEVASPRMVEALYMGCVPVLIKHGYVPPFGDVLNWKAFAVMIPIDDIPNLKKILLGIPQRQYIKMQRRGIKVRRHFEVNYPTKRFDVFHMILHSIWLRRLNIRLHDHVND